MNARYAPYYHPLIQGLLVELPPIGAPFSDEARRAWLETAQAALRLLYASPRKREWMQRWDVNL